MRVAAPTVQLLLVISCHVLGLTTRRTHFLHNSFFRSPSRCLLSTDLPKIFSSSRYKCFITSDKGYMFPAMPCVLYSFASMLAVPRSRVTGSRDRRDPNRVPLAASSVPRAFHVDLGLGSGFFGVSKPSQQLENKLPLFFHDFWCPPSFHGIHMVIQEMIPIKSWWFVAALAASKLEPHQRPKLQPGQIVAAVVWMPTG